MKDPYGREINYLRVSVTDRCNLRCRYCMPKEGLSLFGHNDILRYEEILRVVRIAVSLGVAKVRVTGGEPLVRKGITEFLRALGEMEGIADLSLTTNGALLEAFAGTLKTAGVRRINVSLDSLDKEKYRFITRGGSMEAVLRGISRARDVGMDPVKINVVTMRGFNDDEILAFADLTLDNPYEVRFIELMPLGGDAREPFGSFISASEIRKAIEERHVLKEVNIGGNGTDGPAVMCRLEGGVGLVGFISPISSHFCHRCNRLRLTADGHLRSCLFSDGEISLKEALRKGCSDGVLEELILRAVNAKPMRHDIAQGTRAALRCRRMSAIGG